MNTTPLTAKEQRVRRRAARLGFQLTKSRSGWTAGTYGLADENNWPVLRVGETAYGCDLDEVEEYLDTYARETEAASPR